MKKRIFILSLVLTFILGIAMVQETFAAEYNTENVFDMADLLTDTEEEGLRNFAKQYEEYDISIIFMTTNDAEGKTTQNYSNDFYDTHGFRKDGIMFSIDMDNREIYIDTVGKCIAMISDSAITNTLDDTYMYASDGEYARCLEEMSKSICKIIDGKENPLGTAIKPSPLTLVIMAVITGIVVLVLLAAHNKANRKVEASQYIGSTFVVTNRDTLFLGCRKEVIPDYYAEKESSSGSSSHMSSGGVSHGGGGHKF